MINDVFVRHIPPFTQLLSVESQFLHLKQQDAVMKRLRFDVGNEHGLVEDIDAQTLIKLVKFLKRGKAPSPIPYQ